MEPNEKNIEDFIKNIMQYDDLEKPSEGFTNSIMKKIELASETTTTAYKPLIPSYVWGLIFGSFAIVISYLYLKAPATNSKLLDKIDLSILQFNFFENINMSVSNTTFYAVILFAIMIVLQIPLLKNYFNSRLNY